MGILRIPGRLEEAVELYKSIALLPDIERLSLEKLMRVAVLSEDKISLFQIKEISEMDRRKQALTVCPRVFSLYADGRLEKDTLYTAEKLGNEHPLCYFSSKPRWTRMSVPDGECSIKLLDQNYLDNVERLYAKAAIRRTEG